MDNQLPIFAIYLECLTHEFIQCFGSLIVFEIFVIKYWIEFVWKSLRQIDDNFIINFLSISNASLASIFSYWMVVRGDEHINAIMVMNEFDWTQLFYKRKETLNLRYIFVDVTTFTYSNITLLLLSDWFQFLQQCLSQWPFSTLQENVTKNSRIDPKPQIFCP